jgi:hypothetical protein
VLYQDPEYLPAPGRQLDGYPPEWPWVALIVRTWWLRQSGTRFQCWRLARVLRVTFPTVATNVPLLRAGGPGPTT